jgi:hypothetical protein
MKALIVYYTNSKDIMKKKVCFNLEDLNRVYTYGYIQKITDQDNKPVGIIEADRFFMV